MGTILSKEVTFWKDFHRNFYEQRPVVFSNFNNISSLFSMEELFFSMKKAQSSYEKYSDRKFSIWINNKLNVDINEVGIKEQDSNILEYIERITKFGNNFTYSLNNIQEYDQELWIRVMNFIQEFIDIVGVPSDEVDIDTFLGKYNSTPRGIHTDQASTLMTVLYGKKRMLLWPPEYFEGKIDINNIQGSELRKTIINEKIEDFIEDAIVLEGYEGDTLYWPANYWHASYASEAEVNVVMNIGFFYSEKSDTLIKQLNTSLWRVIEKNIDIIKHHKDVNGVPLEEYNLLNMLVNSLTSESSKFTLYDYISKRYSANGFKQLPAELTLKYNTNLTYKLQSNVPLRFSKANKKLLVYMHGRRKEYIFDEELVKIIENINNGEFYFDKNFLKFYEDLLNTAYIIASK